MLIDIFWLIAQATGSEASVPNSGSGSGGELIDWFTVVAQILNFLILVALLRYFLFGRIIAAMDRRKEKIARRWEDAERQEREAAQEAEEHRRRQRELDEQREQLLDEAKQEAAQRRDELIAEAREDADRMREHWRDSIRRDQAAFLDDLRRRAAEGTCSITRRALADLADAELERQIIRTFLDTFRALDQDHQEELRESLRNSDHPPTIRSAFDIPDDLRNAITGTLRETLGDGVDPRFEADSRLICGIELNTDGRKVAWDLDHYLDDLLEELGEAIRSELSDERDEGPHAPSEKNDQPNDDDRDGRGRRPKSGGKSRSKASRKKG